MGIESNHVEYQKYAKAWARCHDAVDGSDAIKGKTVSYLPMLPGMIRTSDGSELYSIYLDNALWYPGTGRTFDAYVGTLFRKPPTKELSKDMEPLLQPITPSGQDDESFAADLAGEIIMGYRPGILVDFPQIDTDGMSLSEAEAAGARPYATLYPANRIVDWEQRLTGGKLETIRVVLEEHMAIGKARAKYGDNALAVSGYGTIRRELVLNGIYSQNIYLLTETGIGDGEYQKIGISTPMINGSPLDYIPFIPVTPKGIVWDLKYPLINDVAVLNVADYRNEALYRDALLFNGRPTPCVSGLMKETGQKSVTLGSSSILQFEEGGSWGTLGGGADAVGLKDSGEDLKQRMALVGSRALAEDPRGVEAADTAAMHRQGEDAVLSSIANGVSAGMTRALEIMRDWNRSEGDIQYNINTDFIPADIDPTKLTALWQMYVSGNISYETFYYNLERGELYPADWTLDKEAEAIAEDAKKKGDAIDIGISDIDESPAAPSA